MSHIVKFEALKRKAMLACAANRQSAFHLGMVNGEGAVLALQFMRLGAAERADLVAFADAFATKGWGDEIAAAAQQHDPAGLMALRAREEAISNIDTCDVRRAGALIQRFPGILPRRLQGKPFSAYMADNGDADWVLEFADPMKEAA